MEAGEGDRQVQQVEIPIGEEKHDQSRTQRSLHPTRRSRSQCAQTRRRMPTRSRTTPAHARDPLLSSVVRARKEARRHLQDLNAQLWKEHQLHREDQQGYQDLHPVACLHSEYSHLDERADDILQRMLRLDEREEHLQTDLELMQLGMSRENEALQQLADEANFADTVAAANAAKNRELQANLKYRISMLEHLTEIRAQQRNTISRLQRYEKLLLDVGFSLEERPQSMICGLGDGSIVAFLPRDIIRRYQDLSDLKSREESKYSMLAQDVTNARIVGKREKSSLQWHQLDLNGKKSSLISQNLSLHSQNQLRSEHETISMKECRHTTSILQRTLSCIDEMYKRVSESTYECSDARSPAIRRKNRCSYHSTLQTEKSFDLVESTFSKLRNISQCMETNKEIVRRLVILLEGNVQHAQRALNLHSLDSLWTLAQNVSKRTGIDVQLKFTIEDVLKERREKASPKKNRRQRCKAANESPDRRSSQNVAPGSHVVRSSLIPPEECDLMNRDTMDSSDEGYSSFESVRSDRSIRGSNYQSEADEENFTPTSSPSASPLSSFSSFGKLVHSSSDRSLPSEHESNSDKKHTVTWMKPSPDGPGTRNRHVYVCDNIVNSTYLLLYCSYFSPHVAGRQSVYDQVQVAGMSMKKIPVVEFGTLTSFPSLPKIFKEDRAEKSKSTYVIVRRQDSKSPSTKHEHNSTSVTNRMERKFFVHESRVKLWEDGTDSVLIVAQRDGKIPYGLSETNDDSLKVAASLILVERNLCVLVWVGSFSIADRKHFLDRISQAHLFSYS